MGITQNLRSREENIRYGQNTHEGFSLPSISAIEHPVVGNDRGLDKRDEMNKIRNFPRCDVIFRSFQGRHSVALTLHIYFESSTVNTKL